MQWCMQWKGILLFGNALTQLALKGIVRSVVWHSFVTSSCKQLVAERAGLACCKGSSCVYYALKSLCSA